jgi:hypothetical protein
MKNEDIKTVPMDEEMIEAMRENIIINLISQERNRFLENPHPYKLQNDMAITYRWAAKVNVDSIHSALIDDTLMSRLGLNHDELHKLAFENTMRLFPANIISMEQMFMDESTPSDIDNFHYDDIDKMSPPMYVLSNNIKINGASTIVYPGILEKLAEKFGSDFYILPSSVHEVILIPDDGNSDESHLSWLVRTVNMEQVSINERLSKSAYKYDKEEKSLKRIEEQTITVNQEFVNHFLYGNEQDPDMDLEP